jgi:hypothetical protein
VPNYVLLPGTQSGLRVADERTGKTMSVAGRLLDNMTAAGAEDALRSLEHLSKLRHDHAEGAERRNDLIAILDEKNRKP